MTLKIPITKLARDGNAERANSANTKNATVRNRGDVYKWHSYPFL